MKKTKKKNEKKEKQKRGNKMWNKNCMCIKEFYDAYTWKSKDKGKSDKYAVKHSRAQADISNIWRLRKKKTGWEKSCGGWKENFT